MVSIDVDISLVYQMVNFLVLLFALNFVLYRPIRGIIKKRAEKIAQLNSDITSNQENAQAKAGELEAQQAEARRIGMAAREELKAEGQAKERELIDQATGEMEKAVAKVREQVADEIGQARDELKGQVETFGAQLAEKILGRSIQ